MFRRAFLEEMSDRTRLLFDTSEGGVSDLCILRYMSLNDIDAPLPDMAMEW